MAISITFYQFEFLSTPSVGRATRHLVNGSPNM